MTELQTEYQTQPKTKAGLWGVPGVVVILFVMVVLQFLYGATITPYHNLLKDSDTAWLLKTGLWIWEHHAIPHTNVFGLDAAQTALPWVTYQWLFEVMLAGFYKLLGLHGVVAFGAILAGLVIVQLGDWLAERKFLAVPTILAVGLLSNWTLYLFSSVRPYLLSFVLTITLVRWLQSERSLRAKTLGCMGLFAFWANCHLGFVAGLGILITYCLVETFKTRNKNLLWLALLPTLSTGLNPHGFALMPYLWNLAHSPFMSSRITELHSTNFHDFPDLLRVVVVAIACATLAFWDERVRPEERIWFLLSIGMGLYSIRHWYLFTIFSAPILATAIEQGWHRWQSAPVLLMNSRVEKPWGWVILSSLLVLVMAKAQAFPAVWNRLIYPDGLIQYLEQRHLQVKILTEPMIGSYLLLNSPARGILDSRMDMYGDTWVQQAMSAYEQTPGWLNFIQQQQIHYVVYPATSHAIFIDRLKQQAGWRVAYQDRQVVLLSDQGSITTNGN